jgi:hypothetical protein
MTGGAYPRSMVVKRQALSCSVKNISLRFVEVSAGGGLQAVSFLIINHWQRFRVAMAQPFGGPSLDSLGHSKVYNPFYSSK